MTEINQETAMNTETKQDAMVPLPAAAREIHAPQINSEALFNASLPLGMKDLPCVSMRRSKSHSSFSEIALS